MRRQLVPRWGKNWKRGRRREGRRGRGEMGKVQKRRKEGRVVGGGWEKCLPRNPPSLRDPREGRSGEGGRRGGEGGEGGARAGGCGEVFPSDLQIGPYSTLPR